MDVLEKYKKTWANQPEEINKISKLDIYKMTQSRSSSIVKWIFIISILEFVILNGLNLLFSDSNDTGYKMIKELGLYQFFIIYSILSYVIILYFIVRFYLNYKKISVIDNSKNLMNKILKTRRTVKHYVLFNLISIGFFMSIMFYYILSEKFTEMSSQKLMISIVVITVVLTVVLLIFWLFYQLIYGILLRKLKRNYKELANLDALN